MSLDSSLRAWSDSQLANAVMTSTNWRAVMRALGLNATSASQKRRWSDAQLRQAVIESRSWQEVISRLGLTTGYGATTHIKSHTVRLGLETSHLSRLSHTGRLPSEPRAQASDLKAQLKYLRVGAGTLAATWFALRGCAVSLPIEPALYRAPSGYSLQEGSPACLRPGRDRPVLRRRRRDDHVPDPEPGHRRTDLNTAQDLPEVHRRERPRVARGRRNPKHFGARLGVIRRGQAEMISPGCLRRFGRSLGG